MDTTIQHWLTAVARAAGLPGADELELNPDAETASAWEAVAAASGITDDELARAVADHFHLEVARAADAEPRAHTLVPAAVARKLGVLPLSCSDRTLVVATADPVSLEAERELDRISDRTVVYRVTPPEEIGERIDRIYEEDDAPRHEVPALGPETEGTRRVLVVEDEPESRLLLRSVLEQEGFEVFEAEDGETALEILDREGSFHLMTLDLALPGIGGLEVLERLRGRPRWRHLPVVVATAHGDPETEVELFEAGADDFIVKPVDPRRFALRVQAVLRRKGASAG